MGKGPKKTAEESALQRAEVERVTAEENRRNREHNLRTALDAVAKLLEMFRIERFAFLGAAIVSFVIFVYCTIKLFSGAVSTNTATMVLGGSGIATVASFRVSYYLSRSFALVEGVLGQPQKAAPNGKEQP